MNKLGWVVLATSISWSVVRADEPDGASLLRMGGEAAVPLSEAGPRAPVEVVVVPGGGPAIARTEGGQVVTWDAGKGVATALPITTSRLLAASAASLVTADDGEGKVTRWRVGTWRPIAELAVEGAVESARFSHDGHHLVVASEGPQGRRLSLFGGAIGLSLKRLDRADSPRGSPIAVATDRAAFVVRGGRALAVVSLPRFEPLRELALEDDARVEALAFATETELVAVQDGRALRWDSHAGTPLGEARLPERCGRLALSEDGRLAVCAPTSDKGAPVTAAVVDIQSGQVRTTFRAPGRGAPVFDRGVLRIAFPGSAAVPVWEVTVDGVTTTLPGGALAGAVRQLVVLGPYVVALEDGLVRAWDPVTLAEAWRIPTGAIGIAPLPGGRLALAGDGLWVHDPATGDTSGLTSVRGRFQAIASDGAQDTLALLERDGRVLVHALADKRPLAAMPRARKDRGLPGVLALAPDRSAVFAEGRLASLPPARAPKATPLTKTARLAAWLGTRLLVVEGDVPRLVDGSSWPAVASGANVTALAASSDGAWVALGTAEGKVLLFDGQGAVRVERVLLRGAVTALTFDLAARRLWVAGTDGPHSVVLGWALPAR